MLSVADTSVHFLELQVRASTGRNGFVPSTPFPSSRRPGGSLWGRLLLQHQWPRVLDKLFAMQPHPQCMRERPAFLTF